MSAGTDFIALKIRCGLCSRQQEDILYEDRFLESWAVSIIPNPSPSTASRTANKPLITELVEFVARIVPHKPALLRRSIFAPQVVSASVAGLYRRCLLA